MDDDDDFSRILHLARQGCVHAKHQLHELAYRKIQRWVHARRLSAKIEIRALERMESLIYVKGLPVEIDCKAQYEQRIALVFRSAIMDHKRTTSIRRASIVRNAPVEPQTSVDPVPSSQAIAAALETLLYVFEHHMSPLEREVLCGRLWNLSHKEIADHLNTTEASSRTAYSSLVKKCRHFLSTPRFKTIVLRSESSARQSSILVQLRYTSIVEKNLTREVALGLQSRPQLRSMTGSPLPEAKAWEFARVTTSQTKRVATEFGFSLNEIRPLLLHSAEECATERWLFHEKCKGARVLLAFRAFKREYRRQPSALKSTHRGRKEAFERAVLQVARIYISLEQGRFQPCSHSRMKRKAQWVRRQLTNLRLS